MTIWEDVLDAARAARRADLEQAALEGRPKRPPGAGVAAVLIAAAGLRARHRPRAQPNRPAPPAPCSPVLRPRSPGGRPARGGVWSAATTARATTVTSLSSTRRSRRSPGSAPICSRCRSSNWPTPSATPSWPSRCRPASRSSISTPRSVGAEDLVAVEPPRQLRFAIYHLYGGGYLNRLWGARKVEMLRAAGVAPRGERAAFAGFLREHRPKWSGSRDSIQPTCACSAPSNCSAPVTAARSRLCAGSAPLAPVLDTGDDAIGLLGSLPAASQTGDAGPGRRSLRRARLRHRRARADPAPIRGVSSTSFGGCRGAR